MFTRILILCLCFSLTACGSMAKNGAQSRAFNNYQEGEYQDTIDIVERALRSYEYSDEDKARLLYLKALSYDRLGDSKTAFVTLTYIVFKFPETEFGFRANAEIKTLELSNSQGTEI